jgi:hypothetical protein
MSGDFISRVVREGLENRRIKGGSDDAAIVRAAVEFCAMEVESAGCICFDLEKGSAEFTGSITGHSPREVIRHDKTCPFTQAEMLRGLAQ